MNDTRIERLLQAVAPAVDRARSDTARDLNRHDKFDSHMREMRGATNAHPQPRAGGAGESDALAPSSGRDSSQGREPRDTGATKSGDQRTAAAPNENPVTSTQGTEKDREDTSAAETESSDESNSNFNGSMSQMAVATKHGGAQGGDTGAAEPLSRDGSIAANSTIPSEAATSTATTNLSQRANIPGSGSQAESAPTDSKTGASANESVATTSAMFVDADTADSAHPVNELAATSGSVANAHTEAVAMPTEKRSDIDPELASTGLASNMTAVASGSQAPSRQHARLGKNEDSMDSPFDAALSGAVDSQRASNEVEMSLDTPASSVEVPEREASAGRTDELARRHGGASDLRVDGIVTSLNRLHRSGGGGRGNPSGENQDGPRVDTARFVDRVARAFNSAQERGGTLTLRLSPAELGSVRLEIAVKDGAMTAAVETESNLTRKVLLEHLPALRERLAEQNIRIERFNVDVRSDSSGHQAGGGPHGEANHDSPSVPRQGRLASRPAQVVASTANATQTIGSAALNLVV